MSIIAVVVSLVVAGLVLWLVNNYVPMNGKIKTILNVVVVLAVILWLLYSVGAFGSQTHMRVGNVHMWWWDK